MKKIILTIGMAFIPAIGFTLDVIEDLHNSRTKDVIEKKIDNFDSYNQQKTIYQRFATKISRLPAVIGTPNYSGTFIQKNGASAILSFWREIIDDKDRLFVAVKATPLNGNNQFLFCPGGNEFSIVQNGVDYIRSFNVSIGDGKPDGVCKFMTNGVEEIFLVDQWSINVINEIVVLLKPFQEDGAFIVSYIDPILSGSISVPAAPSYTDNTIDRYNSNTGQLTLPNVNVGNDNYSANLIFEGNDLFRLLSVIKND